MNTRTDGDRKRFREEVASGERSEGDPRELPWGVRGPPGPKDGGPTTWMGQRFCANTGRWANAGGRHKEKYALFRAKKNEGLTGKELHYWHPMAKDGYWAKQAADEGVMAPWEEKEADKSAQ